MYKKFKKYHVSIFLQIVRLLKVLVLSPLPARGGRNPKAFLQKKNHKKHMQPTVLAARSQD
jgi:hypothetical protein